MRKDTIQSADVDAWSQRRLSGILFWYLFREYALPLVCCLSAFTVLFLINDVFDVLGDFLKSEVPLREIIWYFVILEPVNLLNVFPMSALLSASFMVTNLIRHHELAAIRAAGLSLVRCALPVWLTALSLSGVSFWVGESLAPWSIQRSSEIRDFWTESSSVKRRKGKLAFSNSASRRDWYFEQFQSKGIQHGVLIKQFREDDAPDWELQADEAEYVGGEWVFRHGVIRHFDLAGRLPEGEDQLFQEYRPVEGLIDARVAGNRFRKPIDESPGMILNHLRPADELSVARMLRIMAANPCMPRTARDIYLSTIFFRISFPFSCLVGALLGVALTINWERSSVLRGFALAVGLMAVYYVSSQVFLVLGKNGYVPPIIAGSLPTVGFLSWGCWTMYRKR